MWWCCCSLLAAVMWWIKMKLKVSTTSSSPPSSYRRALSSVFIFVSCQEIASSLLHPHTECAPDHSRIIKYMSLHCIRITFHSRLDMHMPYVYYMNAKHIYSDRCTVAITIISYKCACARTLIDRPVCTSWILLIFVSINKHFVLPKKSARAQHST